MKEIALDEFETFIIQKDTPEQSIDLQKMMINITRQYSFSMKEFWEMPLNLVLELLGMFVSPTKKPMSRKTLIDHERKVNLSHGY